MTTPTPATNPGQTDTTPVAGGSLPYAASGGAGADREDAPDVHSGSVHRPGKAPGVDVPPGPAMMKVGAKKSSKKK